MHAEDEKESVHTFLTLLNDPGGLLHEPAQELLDFFEPSVLQEVKDEYVSTLAPAVSEGRMAIVTAGPPGVGKSFSMDHKNLTGYCRIDPDRIKDHLILAANSKGLFNHFTEHILPDGKPIALRELGGLVHDFSTYISDAIRHDCYRDQVNVVIEGTLSWQPLAELYTTELARSGYSHLEIYEVQTPLEIALRQAKKRWWEGRISGHHLGGRFVPETYIRSQYEEDGTSICTANAGELYERACEKLHDTTLSRYEWQPTGAPLLSKQFHSIDGELQKGFGKSLETARSRHSCGVLDQRGVACELPVPCPLH